MNPYLMLLIGYYENLDNLDSDSDESDMEELEEYSIAGSNQDEGIVSNDDIFETVDDSDGGSGTAYSSGDVDVDVDDIGNDYENDELERNEDELEHNEDNELERNDDEVEINEDDEVEIDDDYGVERNEDNELERNEDNEFERNDDNEVDIDDDDEVERNEDNELDRNVDVELERNEDIEFERNEDNELEPNVDVELERNDDVELERNDERDDDSDDLEIDEENYFDINDDEDENELEINDDDEGELETNDDDDEGELETNDDDEGELETNDDEEDEADNNDEDAEDNDDTEEGINQDEETNDANTEPVRNIQVSITNESANRSEHDLSDNIVLSQVIFNTTETIESISIVTNAAAQVATESLPSTSKTETLIRKKKIDETEAPPSKMRRLDPCQDDDDDGETCPICLDRWSNTGDHKLVALKCGHLFGAACVQRWLKAQPAKHRCCPTCKTKASIREIRYIYARKLVAADNSEITNLQKELDKAQTDKSRVELECMQLKVSNRNYLLQLQELKSVVQYSQPNVVKHWSFSLEKNLEVCEGRVLTYNCRSYDLYVSQKSNNSLFPGYGVKKFNCIDYKFGNNILLHKKPIRDIAYNSNNDLLLSVSLDGTARIVERSIPCQATQPTDPYALWSCAWDDTCQNKFYIGGTSGNLQQYDLRNLNQAVCDYECDINTDKSPVASICSTPYGLVSCQLNTCWLWHSNTQPVPLPIEGPFMSITYEPSLQKLLVACRPNRTERGRLVVCDFNQPEAIGAKPECKVERTFFGTSRASVLCRSAWIKATNETAWVASHSESDSSVYLYNLGNARTVCIPSSEPALDICNIQVNEDNLMATVSENRLRIYKANSRS